MLTVNTLGKFQITDGDSIITEDTLRSVMVEKLLIYMLMYRDKTLTQNEISTALWQNEDVDNPAGALKNLMYRLRKCLISAFGENEYILTNRGSYRWNPEITINMDIESFENKIKLAKSTNVSEEALVLLEQAIMLYEGSFMSQIMDMHWIATFSAYYHSLFITAVKLLAELYVKYERYEDLEKLCNNALVYESGDEQIYCYQIEARMRCGKISLALDSYEKARETMEKELGIRKTTILNKVYQELLSMSKGQSIFNIDEVREDIVEKNPQGVYFCGYPIFKEIYHLEARKCSRNGVPETLILLTLECNNAESEEIAKFRIKRGMNALEETIRECLRVGDVTAKYSDSQFILLLQNCNYDHSMQVANRIMSIFYSKADKYKNLKVLIDIEKVSNAGKLVN